MPLCNIRTARRKKEKKGDRKKKKVLQHAINVLKICIWQSIEEYIQYIFTQNNKRIVPFEEKEK